MSALVLENPAEEINPLTLDLPASMKMGDREFVEFCQRNPDLRIEQDPEGNVIVMLPLEPDSGSREAQLITQLQNWANADKTGIAFSSASLFTLPNRARRSPDASWIRRPVWEKLSPKDRKGFSRICPEFVLELRSRTDRLPPLLAKMEEYLENGTRLGILIDPQEHTVRIHRPGAEVELLHRPASVTAGPEMPGLVFDLAFLW